MKDKRSRRTREQLSQALIGFLLEKPLSEITVTELSDKADLNRATFYLHYGNIYDLFQSIEDDLIEQVENWISSAFPNNSSLFHIEIDKHDNLSLPVLGEVFNFIASNRDVAVVLLKDPGSRLLSRIYDGARELIIKQFLAEGDASNLKRVIYSVDYIINGCIGIIQSWINNGLDIDPETISQITCSLVLQNRKLVQL